MEEDIKISIIVPCYNEEDVLSEFYAAVKDVMENRMKLDEYEVFL